MTNPPVTIGGEALAKGAEALERTGILSGSMWVTGDDANAIIEGAAQAVLEAAAPALVAQVLRPLTRVDIEAAINCLEACATNPGEPERYREWYAEALDRFRQWQEDAPKVIEAGEETP